MNVAALCVLALSALGAGSRGYVLEFSSQSCGPCQQVAPVVAKLEREGLPIRTVDVSSDQSLAQQYSVESIPTFILVVDGQPVERMSGVQSEGRIRQMLARIPREPQGPGNDRLAVDLGDSAPLPRPEVVIPKEPRQPPRSAEIEITEQDQSPRRLWPFKPSKKQSVPADVRGNSPEQMPDLSQSVTETANPMASSVRVQVITGSTLVRGSGTIIESLAGRSTILTCSHITRGATDATKVEVDLFRDGEPVTIVGKIIGSDPEADVGLISIPTDEVWPTSKICAVSQSPGVGTAVSSIGCGGGADPSREQLLVKALNKFSGPDTLICNGIPVQGRSGGGLFDKAGNLVGVCFAADADEKTEQPNGGVYCGLKPIHALLAKHDLAHLIPSDAGESSLADAGTESKAPEWPGSTRESEVAPAVKSAPSDPASDKAFVQESTTPAAEEFATDDAEVVVVIRNRKSGSGGDKVILIHKPSRKFLQFVEGEVSAEASDSTPVSRTAPAPQIEALTQRLVRPKPSTKSLLPTGLESQRLPRPYVRSPR